MLRNVATTKDGTPTNDRRVRRTHAALRNTLIQLVEERDLGHISVADIAEHAGVSRSTFYDHYRDVHELAEAACTSMIDELIESLPVLGPGAVEQDETQSLRAFFTNLAEHAGLYRSLLGPQGSARVIDHIRRRTAATVHIAVRRAAGDTQHDITPPTDIPHDVPSAFTAGALISVAIDWLQRDCPRTPAEMATLTWPLLTAHFGAGTPRSEA
jgi:AcrR family transcriptional regulator